MRRLPWIDWSICTRETFHRSEFPFPLCFTGVSHFINEDKRESKVLRQCIQPVEASEIIKIFLSSWWMAFQAKSDISIIGSIPRTLSVYDFRRKHLHDSSQPSWSMTLFKTNWCLLLDALVATAHTRSTHRSIEMGCQYTMRAIPTN